MLPSKPRELAPSVYQILIALGDGEKHGYAIMKEIAEQTGGAVRLLPGTLYSTIQRMLDEGLLEECPPPGPAGAHDPRRRYYRPTGKGRELARAETRRLAALLRVARKKGFAPRS